MKKLLIGSLLLAGCTTATYAQCDKKVVLTSNKTQYLGADTTVQRSDDESSLVEFTKDSLHVTISGSNGEQKMAGAVKSYTCNWSTPFKEGKTVLKAALVNDNGETRDLTITVTGKAGKIGFLAELEGDGGDGPRRIQLVVDKFEEKK